MPCGPDTRFQPTVEMLAEIDPPVTGRGRSPARPTRPAPCIPPDDLAAIASWCERSGVQLVSDEIYHGLVYPGAPQTSCAWETSRDAIVVNSFSKYFAMTGWRLGWLLVPHALQRAVDRLTGQLLHLPADAAAAGRGRRVHSGVDRRGRRAGRRSTPSTATCCCAGLPEIGLDRLAPADGAFYVYADISDYSTDSLAFCAKLLADTGVAIAPGIDFDTVHGGAYVRLSFAGRHLRHRRGAAPDRPLARRGQRALQPPSIVYDAPVTMPAFGDASQPTSAATSSGSTRRLIALSVSRTFSSTSCSAMPCAAPDRRSAWSPTEFARSRG